MMHRIARGCVWVLVVAGMGAGGGCATRPVVTASPTTKTNFTSAIRQTAVDKVDILFAIDNSGSMGDKQDYLRQAIPDLITRLVTPNCVDAVSGQNYGSSDTNGNCAQGKVEFPPVHDMHVGIVSTSLGERGGDQCPVTNGPTTVVTPSGNTVNTHYDDRGELIARSGDAEGALADAEPANFLNWFPGTAANAGKTASAGAPPLVDGTTLETDFEDLVSGVGVYGCGIESQLESWYRFLVQPDPYDSITVTNGQAQWVGVDTTILQQRHDFLRPDSLVAVIVLTDEDDSEIDVRSYGGEGYQFMSGSIQPNRGTAICQTNPADPGCLPCGTLSKAAQAADPSCALGPYTSGNDWGYNTNLRHVHMKAKYGADPQYPIQRYVLGLSSPTIPDRSGEYPAGAGLYQGLTNLDCTNPLFAASLPDGTTTDAKTLCDLPKGPRTSELVFYAHIGGVPHQLLQQDPTNPDSPQKDALADADWVKILGNDPANYDTTGIDPHMIELYQPRPGLPAPGAANDADPVHGREWVTNQDPREVLPVDREYACTFALAAPRDCTNPAIAGAGCDCPGGLSYADTPPVCDPNVQTNQISAKAYPTIRELYLAKLLGTQGVVSSLCPIHTLDQMGKDPLYGYRPAMGAIVNRLKSALTNQCLPQELTPDATGAVPCLVLVTLPSGSGEGACDPSLGLTAPSADVLGRFQADQHAAWMANGGAMSGTVDPSTLPTCAMGQLTGSALSGGSCAASSAKGWCYVQGAAAGTCPQAILFSPGSPPANAQVSLQCIEGT